MKYRKINTTVLTNDKGNRMWLVLQKNYFTSELYDMYCGLYHFNLSMGKTQQIYNNTDNIDSWFRGKCTTTLTRVGTIVTRARNITIIMQPRGKDSQPCREFWNKFQNLSTNTQAGKSYFNAQYIRAMLNNIKLSCKNVALKGMSCNVFHIQYLLLRLGFCNFYLFIDYTLIIYYYKPCIIIKAA